MTHAWMRVARLVLALMILLAACGGDSSDSPASPTPRGPDVLVDTIEINPAEPAAGAPFVLRVYVKNAGGAAAGAVSARIVIRDMQRRTDDTVGTFALPGLDTGARAIIFETTTRRIGAPGSYQVQVELTPTGPDASTQNNKQHRAFTVK